MQSVVLGAHVFSETRSFALLGLFGLVQYIPFALCALLSGDMADRMPPSRIVVFSNVGFAMVSFLLAGLVFFHAPAPVLLSGSFLLGGLRAFVGPASQALLPQLVPPALFLRAVAWSSSLFQAGLVLGPALGGILLGALGPVRVFALCGVLSLLAAGTLFTVRTGRVAKHPSDQTMPVRIRAGLTFVRNARPLLGAISLDLFAVFFGGVVALLPAFATDVFQEGPRGLGLLRAAPAVGASLMGILLAFFPLRKKQGRTLLLSVSLFGTATILFGRTTSFPFALLCLFVLGAADMISVAIRQALLIELTPDAMRGRVSAVSYVFIGASNELGEFESGLTAAALGARGATVLGGVLTLVTCAFATRIFPELVRYSSVKNSP